MTFENKSDFIWHCAHCSAGKASVDFYFVYFFNGMMSYLLNALGIWTFRLGLFLVRSLMTRFPPSRSVLDQLLLLGC